MFGYEPGVHDGSVVHRAGWDEVHHVVTHMTVYRDNYIGSGTLPHFF